VSTASRPSSKPAPRTEPASQKKIRVLTLKMGLDGHDRGVKVVSRALRDAGVEVIYAGLRQTPEMVVEAGIQADWEGIRASKLGRFQLQRLSDGQFRMDGGAVFGVVPKVLWEKVKTPDARNRVTLATNCLLVRTPDANILIEAGVGPKLSDKERDIYGYEREP